MKLPADFDLSTIPTGPDGQPDKQRMIELLTAQLARVQGYLRDSENHYRAYWESSQTERDELKALQSREVKVLQRWIRRRAIVKQHREFVAWCIAGGLVAVPLFIVACAFAWRLAVWAVVG